MTYDETIQELFEDCPPLPMGSLAGVKKVITHGGKCPDGKASAMVLNAAFEGRVPIEFVVHGTKEHKELKPEPGLLFCDFCVPEENWMDFLAEGAIVLVHHAGAKKIGQKFSMAMQGAFADETDHRGVSGAVLAYEYVWKPLKGENLALKEMVRLAGIRDTWQRTSPDWTRACEQAEALAWWPNENLLATPVESWSSLFEVGSILWERKLKAAAKVGGEALRFFSMDGTRVALFRGMHMSSDVAEFLGDSADLVIGYDFLFEDGKFKQGFSTRSHTDYDCKALATHYGGGGHTKAAGFGIPLGVAPNPYKVTKTIVDAYEGDLFAKVKRLFL